MTLKKEYAMSRSWGEALRRRRKAKGFTQEVVRVRTGISRTILSHYERGAVIPRVTVAYKILKVLDWTLEEWAAAAEEIERDVSWYNDRFDYKYAYSNTQLITEIKDDT